ncbi:MFS transporter [Kitasatospora sp. NPDC097605]|uniref:MFS transporter n=1 Tax=Kitasatospora sp. NPDC097605 TaxID=3157226 RepID=UPI003316538D
MSRFKAIGAPPVRRFLGGYTASMVGDQMWVPILGWTAGQYGQPVVAGLLLSVGTVPRALLMLLGGTLVDRYGIQRLAAVTQAGRILTMLALAAMGVIGLVAHNWIVLLVVALVFGAIDAVNIPALEAAPALIAEPDQLPRLAGLLQTVARLASVVGAPLSGLLIAVGGVSVGAMGCALLFAVALAVLLRAGLPGRRTGTSGALGTGTGGLRYIASNPVLRTLIVAIACLNFAIMSSFNVGITLLVKDHGWSATEFGLFEGSFGAGAMVGAGIVVVARLARRPALVALGWVAVQIPLLVALGFIGSALWISVASGLVGLTLGPASALLVGLVQVTTDRDYIGRVMSVVGFASIGLTPVSYLLFSLVADLAGLGTAFVASGTLELLVLVMLAASPVLRTTTLTGTTGGGDRQPSGGTLAEETP